MARHGGGAFSGKDPSKSTEARLTPVATWLKISSRPASPIAAKSSAYAIGVAEPTSISINTFGTGKLSDDAIEGLVREHFDLRPKGLISMLDLKKPIYLPTASYGHFGRTEASFSWEKTDRAEQLAAAL